MSAAWMMSASVDICWSPNIHLSSENTRWGAGGKRKTKPLQPLQFDRYDHYDRYHQRNFEKYPQIPGEI